MVSSLSSKKGTKTSQQVVKSNLFVRFLEETSSWKNHFEFVWPLKPYLQLKCLIYEQNLISKVLNWHDISPFERNDFHMQNRNVIVLSSSPFCCHPSTKLLTFPGYQHIIALGLFLWSRIQYFSLFLTKKISRNFTRGNLNFMYSKALNNYTNKMRYGQLSMSRVNCPRWDR